MKNREADFILQEGVFTFSGILRLVAFFPID